MTQDEILEVADECGLAGYFELDGDSVGQLMVTAFAKLVAEKEREACAKLCDVLAYHPEFASDATKLAAMAIRARGQA